LIVAEYLLKVSPPAKFTVEYLFVDPVDNPSMDFNKRTHALGPLIAKNPEPVLEGDGAEVFKAGETFLEESAESLKRWEQLGREVTNRTPTATNLRKKADRLAKQANEVSRSLSASLFMQRANWTIAQEVWPDVRKVYNAILTKFRVGCRVMQAMDRKLHDASSKLPPTLASELEELRPLVAARCWACRFLIEQFRCVEKVATSWANRAEDGWKEPIVTLTAARTISLAVVLSKWKEDIGYINYTLMVARRRIWADQKYGLYEAEPGESWFQFGTPGKDIFCTEAFGEF
jgi:hypothetical protein